MRESSETNMGYTVTSIEELHSLLSKCNWEPRIEMGEDNRLYKEPAEGKRNETYAEVAHRLIEEQGGLTEQDIKDLGIVEK
jgi:hypothetical protein